MNFTTREFVCQACSNFCDMKEFNIEGQRTYWGDKCSDKFRKRARTDRQPVIEDLIEWREKLLEEVLLPARGGSRTVGIPRTMFYYDRFPFWCAYFQELGFDVVVSSPTDRKISDGGRGVDHRAALLPREGGARARSGPAGEGRRLHSASQHRQRRGAGGPGGFASLPLEPDAAFRAFAPRPNWSPPRPSIFLPPCTSAWDASTWRSNWRSSRAPWA